MKILLTFFVLLFSSSVLAEDISDFEIEGISVGDSLLDYFSEREIENNLEDQYQYYDDQTFIYYEFIQHPLIEIYESIQFYAKRNDKNYKIYAIYAGNFYKDNVEQCYIEQDKISEEISLMFKNTEKVGPVKRNHPADVTGQSTYTGVYYWFESGDYSAVECYDWSENQTREKGWTDNLRISIGTKELSDWLHQ